MKLLGVCFTKNGVELLKKIREHIDIDLYTNFETEESFKEYASLKGLIEKGFKEYEGIVFVGALGICVRLIAPFLVSKTKDPAVVNIDELGRNAVSVISGHIGGANTLCKEISEITGARPIISTATDLNKKLAIDVFATDNNLIISSMQKAKYVARDILKGKRINILTTYNIVGSIPEEVNIIRSAAEIKTGDEFSEIVVYVGSRRIEGSDEMLRLVPKNINLGIGCRRGTAFKSIDELVREPVFIESIKTVSSIDLKKDEIGLLQFLEEVDIRGVFYSADELNTLEGDFSHSDFVESKTGVGNVCERAAKLSSKKSGDFLMRKTAKNGVTIAAFEENTVLEFRKEL